MNRDDEVDQVLRSVLADVIGLSPDRALRIEPEERLYGAMPELDSLGVAGILAELEERLDLSISEDELSFDSVETYGSLLQFVRKQARR